MKRHLGLGSLVGGGSILLLATQPAVGAATQITGVQVNPGGAGMEVVLETREGDRPQIFTVGRGNALTADIINAQLSLPDGNGYLQNNPAPGISSVVVAQLDANSIRVTVTGESEAPQALVQQGDRQIILSYNPSGVAASSVAQTIPVTAPQTTAQVPAPTVPQTSSFDSLPQVSPGFGQIAQVPPDAFPSVPAPDVLIPNPEITVDGVPVPASAAGYVPPLQARAIAPPLGDISISNVNMSPTEIDLGTAERIPRLVLRDAPARDVLSLLARAAGLNVAYIGEDVRGLDDPVTDESGGGDDADAAPLEVRLSLDIENEPVQDVFNYVLRVTGLQANRVGRTVFVGPRLPDTARNIITRTLRLNQVAVLEALPYLIAQGAERNEIQTRTEITILGEGATARTVTNTTTEVELVTPDRGSAPLPLRGLLVVPDERTNSMTLTGDPRKIEMATALLSQIDLRRRQVALNVRIIDVNLLATEDFGTSFSFGLGNDAYFANDDGAAFFNFGDFRPVRGAELNGSLGSPPIISNPYADSNTFLDFDSPTVNIPGTAPGTIIIDQRPGAADPFQRVDNAQGLNFLQRIAGVSNNPFGAGITDFDLATDNIITIDQEGNISVEPGQFGNATAALPSYFQFPRRFLASLQAQIVSGNAKILTDPTLVVQEGQEASVALTQDVVTNVTVNRDVTAGGVSETREFEIQDAGLTLEVVVNRIDDNGFVTLQVNPAVTAPSQNFDTGDGTITLLARRDLNSGQIRLRDGQTLILSGIIQEQDRTTVTKVPILGDIPILGALFRSTNRENTRQEVIVLLTPQILNDSDLSTFGYGYSPGQEAQDILQRRGVQVP